MSRHRSRQERLPWWVHLTVLTLIIGSTAVSVVTGNPLYAWVCIPAGLFLGSIVSTPRWRVKATRIARNRSVWLLAAGVVFATLAATVATVVAR